MARIEWIEKQQRLLLPVEYHHFVFGIPHCLEAITYQNKREVYNILFRSVARAMEKVSRDEKYLGASIGYTAILHTWSNNLMQHTHLHCIVPGGGISLDGKRWVNAKAHHDHGDSNHGNGIGEHGSHDSHDHGEGNRNRGNFLPIKVLREEFSRLFIDYLQEAYNEGKLSFYGEQQHLTNPQEFTKLLTKASQSKWTVYSKKSMEGANQILNYLAYYTHRIAISNERIVKVENDEVTFTVMDYAINKLRTMKLHVFEFIRRFLLHVVPEGFQRIRHFGFLTNRVRDEKLAEIRELLGIESPQAPTIDKDESWEERYERVTGKSVYQCQCCVKGRLKVIEAIPAKRFIPPSLPLPFHPNINEQGDSS